MKNIFGLFFLLTSLLLSSGIFAGDNSTEAANLWQKLLMRIETFGLQKKIGENYMSGQGRSIGFNESDLYWKGEAKHNAIDADEMAAFKKATAFGVAGESKQSKAAFSEFIKRYSSSSLREDAEQALALLSK